METTSHTTFLHTLTEQEDNFLLEKSEKVFVKKNTVIAAEKEENTGVYILQSGLVKIFRIQGANLFILGLAAKGDFIGLDAALLETCNKTTCVAAQDSVLLFIPQHTLKEILKKHPKLAIKLMAHLSERVNQLESRIYNVNHKKVLTHFAELIYTLSSTSYKTVIVPNIISINEIADLIGTTKYYIYKLIQKLEDKNAITFSDRKLKITNKEVLRLLSNKNVSAT